MNEVIDRPAQHIDLSPIKEADIRDEKGERYIQLLHSRHDDRSEGDDAEEYDGVAAPLSRAQPRIVGEKDGRHDAECGRVEDVFALPFEYIFGSHSKEGGEQA